jgi:hypothetical protein
MGTPPPPNPLSQEEMERLRFENDKLRAENTSPESLRMSATQAYRESALFEQMGILLGARMHSASDAALDIYSPRAEATTAIME